MSLAPPPSTVWTAWQPLPAPTPSVAVLAETLEGGQAFRWMRVTASSGTPAVTTDDATDGRPAPALWLGQWGEQVVRIRITATGWDWCEPATRTGVSAASSLSQSPTAAALAHYLGLDAGWPARTDALPWRSDAHLARCVGAFPGLRLLHQPFGETLLCFLCSATKQIVQIKQMTALLATRLGREIAPGWWRLPTWEELAATPEPALRACALGFRARYIKETALWLHAHPGWLEATEQAPYPEAKARLCSLPGVGEKVADCVLLFGAGRLEAFPVDVWILRAMQRHYALEAWTPAQVAHFGRVHFGPLAGFAQQFLFAWERAHG